MLQKPLSDRYNLFHCPSQSIKNAADFAINALCRNLILLVFSLNDKKRSFPWYTPSFTGHNSPKALDGLLVAAFITVCAIKAKILDFCEYLWFTIDSETVTIISMARDKKGVLYWILPTAAMLGSHSMSWRDTCTVRAPMLLFVCVMQGISLCPMFVLCSPLRCESTSRTIYYNRRNCRATLHVPALCLCVTLLIVLWSICVCFAGHIPIKINIYTYTLNTVFVHCIHMLFPYMCVLLN